MPRDARFDILFEPVQIGPKTLRNRFYQVPHCTGFGVEKPWSQAAHRAVKAEGGWAAVCTEYCTVSADADETPFISARMWDDHDLRHLALTCDAAHAHGALAGVELSHSGAHGENGETRLPPPAPSQITSDYSNITPKAMEQLDIDRIVSDWVAAAIRSRDAGFDIVYVYGGHSYLLGQMLSPFYNQRTDAYGGSLANRARMWIETLQAVRDAVGSDCAIACRMAVSAAGGPGVELDEGLEFVRMADHLVDLWDVHIGSILEWSKDSGASRFFTEGWQLEWTGHVREATEKPIVGVGRLTTPERMAEIIESGVWDLIGAARPNIADPFLPEKIRTGRSDDIRACIGCNMCISKGDVRRHIGCTQNATAGEEHRRGWHPERFDRARNADREVLVVGAGPAGMECALVLGRRGMRRVRLVDAADEPGGVTRWIPRLPGLAEWDRLRTWRLGQLAKLENVEIETGKRPPGPRVLVLDCEGYFMGAGMAELLRAHGHEVELMTSCEKVAPLCDETLEGPLLRRHLHDLGVHMRAETWVTRIEPGGVAAETELGETFELEADAVVLVTQRVSHERLYLELAAAGAGGVYRIGDCVAPRLLADAIWDGHRLGREIDSPDPSRPLPHLRERPGFESDPLTAAAAG